MTSVKHPIGMIGTGIFRVIPASHCRICERRVKDNVFLPGIGHPCIKNILCRGLPSGKVLTGGSPMIAASIKSLPEGGTVKSGVTKVIVIRLVFGVPAGCALNISVEVQKG